MKSGRRSAALAAFAMTVLVSVTAIGAGTASAYEFASTNDLNRAAGAPHVELVSAEPGNVTLGFATALDGYALIEYRVDGEVVDLGTNWITGDVLQPYVCVETTEWVCTGPATSIERSFAANSTVEVRLAITDHPEWSFDWTTFSAPPAETGDVSWPLTKADCRNGGWALFGFSNQGHCISYLTTSKDRR
jgi:hypothetical protein